MDTSGMNDYDSLGSLPGVGPGTGIPSTPQVIFALKLKLEQIQAQQYCFFNPDYFVPAPQCVKPGDTSWRD